MEIVEAFHNFIDLWKVRMLSSHLNEKTCGDCGKQKSCEEKYRLEIMEA